MTNTSELVAGSLGTSLSAVGTAIQTNELLQTISLIITIIGGLITFVIVPLINWWREAKKDGKIDTDELREGAKIVSQGSQEVKEQINKTKGGE